MPEAITVITASDLSGNPRGFLTKRVTQKKIEPYNKVKFFTSYQAPSSSIHDLANLLDRLGPDPHSAVIRGRKIPSADAVHQRICLPTKEARAYDPCPAQWLCLDVDGLPLDFIGCDAQTIPPVLSRRFIAKCLPIAFHNVTYYWQLSSSHGYKPGSAATVSMHLWFWLDRPCSDEEIKQYAQLLNRIARLVHRYEGRLVDPSFYNPVQLHYTADPILVDVEPLPYARRGLDRFDRDIVPLGVDLDVEPGAWQRYLARIGDDKDGFHHPILQATGSYVHEFGKVAAAAREALKAAVRQAIDVARPGRRSPDEIARYRSDDFLDPAIDGAIADGFGQAGADAAAEAAGLQFVYCLHSSTYFHKERRYSCKADGVRMAFRASKDITKSRFFLDAVQHVDMVRAIPGHQDCLLVDQGMEVWSSWPGRTLEPTYGNASWFTDHIAFLCDDNLQFAASILDWVAHLLTKPGKRILWAPVFGSSRTGVGKSAVGVLLSKLIKGTHVLTENDITEKYKDFVIDSELAVVPEIRINSKTTVIDMMKAFITEPRINIRRFGQPHVQIDNYCHWWFETNYRDALPLHQDGDRRYAVIFTDREPREPAYYIALRNHIEGPDAADVMGWALNRDLSRFNPYAPPLQTAAAQQMAELARPADEQIIIEAIKERIPPFDFKVCFCAEVLGMVGRQLRVRPPGPQALRRMLERNGGTYQRVHGEAEHGRTLRSVFIFDAANERLGDRSEQELFQLAMDETSRRAKRAQDQRIKEAEAIAFAQENIVQLARNT